MINILLIISAVYSVQGINQDIHQVIVSSKDASLAAICFPSKNLQIQLVTNKTIFPDSSDLNEMLVNTSFTIRGHQQVTSDWSMKMMKYNNAYYQGDELELLSNLINSDAIQVTLHKSGHQFLFEIDNTEEFNKVLTPCLKDQVKHVE